MFNLEWLLNPLSIEEFIANWWQKEPGLVATNRPEYYRDLFGLAQMETLLEYGQPKPPSIRITSSKENGDTSVPMLPNGRLNMDEVRREYANGNTIIVNSVEDFSPNVARMVQAMQQYMSYRVQANAYLTPASNQGFKPHYDTHDVLVVQVEGEKVWRIYDEESRCPLHKMSNGDPIKANGVSSSTFIKLTPGDLLYVPRGWIHEAETMSCASLHLTFGIHSPTGRDLVIAVVDRLSHIYPDFREALPIGFLRKPIDELSLTGIYDGLLSLVHTNGSVKDAVESIEDNLIRLGRSAGDGKMFSSLNSLDDVTLDSKMERRTNLQSRVIPVGDEIGIQFSHVLVLAPNSYREGMEFVEASVGPFLVRDIPGLDEEHRINLVVNLTRDGFLRFAG